jgi:tRNA(fMet)-specific endonuclease VapC
MPHKQVVLDTNIVIGLFAGDPIITDAIAKKEGIFLPVPALGELYRGAFGSMRRDENLNRIESFAKAVTVLVCDPTTAKHYGELKQSLRLKGRPIPENDLWIAALAKQYSLAVTTRDEHFKEIAGLALDFIDQRKNS